MALLLLVLSLPKFTIAGSPVARDFIIYQGEQDQVTPAVAYNPILMNYLVVWSNDRPGNDDIYARRLSAHGKHLRPWFSIAAGTGFERRNPDVAFNDALDEFLVVWEEEPHAGYITIRGIRVSKYGELIPPVIEISSGPALKNCQKPSVAYASTSDKYLVVWQNMVLGGIHSTIEVQVISSSGVPDGGNLSLSATSGSSISDSNPDVAYNRSHNEYLVVWERVNQNIMPVDADLYGRLVSGNGAPQGPAAESISSEKDDQLNPTVAAIPTVPGEGKYFVAWESLYAPGNMNIYGKRLTHDLSSDSFIWMLSTSLLDDSNPSVAADEHSDQFLIAWSQPWGSGSNSQISVRYFPQETNTQGDSFQIGGYQTGMYSSQPATVAGTSGDFLVAFSDLTLGLPDKDIFGQLLGNRQYIPLTIR